jgi:hypothetical protein
MSGVTPDGISTVGCWAANCPVAGGNEVKVPRDSKNASNRVATMFDLLFFNFPILLSAYSELLANMPLAKENFALHTHNRLALNQSK